MKKIIVAIVFLATSVACGNSNPSTVTTTPIAVIQDITPTDRGIYPFVTAQQANAGNVAWNNPIFTAEKFLRNYLGFTRLIMGEFRQGDSRSGEVTATTRQGGFVTTVLVRKIGTGDAWTVIGALTDNIVIHSPKTGDTISNPVVIKGTSTAFEGNVVVEVRRDGQTFKDGNLGLVPLTGGSNGEFGPLEGVVPYKAPGTAGGAVVASTHSAEDGHVEEATVVRVGFSGTPAPAPAPAPPAPPRLPPTV